MKKMKQRIEKYREIIGDLFWGALTTVVSGAAMRCFRRGYW